MDVLEFVQLILPAAIKFQPHLDAAKNHFLSSFEIYSELDHIAIVDGKWFRLLAGRAQPDVIEEGSAATFDILDVPLSALVPELAMPTTDDLRLEAYRGG